MRASEENLSWCNENITFWLPKKKKKKKTDILIIIKKKNKFKKKKKKKKKKADILIIVKDKDFLKKGTMHNFISFKHKWIWNPSFLIGCLTTNWKTRISDPWNGW